MLVYAICGRKIKQSFSPKQKNGLKIVFIKVFYAKNATSISASGAFYQLIVTNYKLGLSFTHSATGGMMPRPIISSRILHKCS